MKKTYLFLLFCLLILRGSTTAQNIYASIGKKADVLTLSNGQYQEIFPNDTLVRIGSVLFNTVTQEVVEFVEKNNADSYVAADVASRFLSVDPIGRKYPELTPYQFASNTPLQAIDLDGLEAFVIHGTNETVPRFNQDALNQMKRITGNTTTDVGFSWGSRAGTFNSRNDERKVSANELVAYIEQQRAALMKNGVISKNEPISLVGYSHGGNVAIQAAAILNEKYDIKVNLLTISTPAYNSETSIPNIEDPASNKGINAHTHISHEKDGVVKIAGGNHAYKGSPLHDVNNNLITTDALSVPYNKTTDSFIEKPDFMRYHTKIPIANGIEKVLEKIPTMKPAPIPTKIDKP